MGSLALLSSTSADRAAEPIRSAPGKVNYGRPFEPPTRPAFIALPPGAVEPGGWLRDWCLTARDGYTGHMDEVDVAFRQAWAADYRMTGDHLTWPKGAWPYEGGGYWFDGLVRLGYVLHDDALIQQAKRRLDVIVTRRNPNGILFLWWLDKNNPADAKAITYDSGWPMWACGLLGRALAAYYAASGDKQVLQTLEAAYSGNGDWLRMGWAMSNPWPAFQTYTWTGNKEIGKALTTLFSEGGKNTQEWSWNRYRRMPNLKPGAEGNDHVVHFLESSTPWALGYLWTGNRAFLEAALAWHDLLQRNAMQPSGVPVADESYGATGAYRGTETCDVAGYLWSQIMLLTISGQGRLADRAERAFFNAGPAVVSRDFKTHAYFQSPNRMDNRPLPEAQRYRFQAKHWPLCCTAALNRILPNYVMHMWMATYDNGLAAAHYGPCKVSALVADRVPVELTCRTDYPFNDVIDISVKPARAAAFPLWFRIPGWCKNPQLSVNGTDNNAAPDAKGFVRVQRLWKPGDVIRLRLPMSVSVQTRRDNNAQGAPYASVSYGPLLFALPIPDTQDANTPDPTVKWSYALDARADELASRITVERRPMPAKWDWPLASPLKLRANAVSFDWRPEPKQALPSAPVVTEAAPEKITLIPYGCTKFRVSMFPITQRTLKLSAQEKSFQTAGQQTLPFCASVVKRPWGLTHGSADYGLDFPIRQVVINGDFWALWGATYKNPAVVKRFTGPDFEHLKRQPDGVCDFPGNDAMICLGSGMWQDDTTGKLYALIHSEYEHGWGDGGGKMWASGAAWSRKKTRLAISADLGRTWRLVGDVLTSCLPKFGDYLKFSGSDFEMGPADFDLYVDTRSGYFYVTCWNGFVSKKGKLRKVDTYSEVARCAIRDKMAPGKWFKFNNGTWTEPGLGGKASRVGMVSYGIYGNTIYSTYLHKYLRIGTCNANTDPRFGGGAGLSDGSIFISACSDLSVQDWTPMAKLLDEPNNGLFGITLTSGDGVDPSTCDRKLRAYNYWIKTCRVLDITLGAGTMKAAGFPAYGSYAYEPHPEAGDLVESRKTRIVGCASPQMQYGGGTWRIEKNQHYYQNEVRNCSTAGGSVQFSFKGADIYWRAVANKDAGKADVFIDGAFQTTVDLYFWNRDLPYGFAFIKKGLDPAMAHTIRIVVRSDKNPESSGTNVRHMALECLTR
jgi:uncharacterized protein